MAKMAHGMAMVFSYVFHPIFLPLWVLFLYLGINPYSFGFSHPFEDGVFLVQTLFICILMPLIAIGVMVRLGLVSGITLPNKTDRIGPYIVTGIFYIWYYLNIKNYGVAIIFELFMLGTLLTLFFCFFINNFTKISMHSAGVGGIIMNFLMAYFGFNYRKITMTMGGDFYEWPFLIVVYIALLIGILVVLSRLYLKSHHWVELLGGLCVGVLGQVIALKLIYII